VYVFDSYLEAAVIAYNRHLISSEGLLKVQASCIEGLYSSKIKFKSEEQQRARMKEFVQCGIVSQKRISGSTLVVPKEMKGYNSKFIPSWVCRYQLAWSSDPLAIEDFRELFVSHMFFNLLVESFLGIVKTLCALKEFL